MYTCWQMRMHFWSTNSCALQRLLLPLALAAIAWAVASMAPQEPFAARSLAEAMRILTASLHAS